MALLTICAAGFGLGVAFDLFALVVALAVASSVALLTCMHVGWVGGLLNSVAISVSLQVGYVAGLVCRRLVGPDFGIQAARLFQPPRRR